MFLRQYIGIALACMGCLWGIIWGYVTPLFIDFSKVPFFGNFLHSYISLIGGGFLLIAGVKLFHSDI